MNHYSQFKVGDIVIVTEHPDDLFLGDRMEVTAEEKTGFGFTGTWLSGNEAGQNAGGFILTRFRKITKLDKVLK